MKNPKTGVEDPSTIMGTMLCGRLCHDLVSPVTALVAALDVLDSDDGMDMREEAIALIRTGIGRATASLEYARLAYGTGSAVGVLVDMREVERLAANMFADSKCELNWEHNLSNVDKNVARTALILLELATNCIPRGGKIRTEIKRTGSTRMRVIAEGERAQLRPDVQTGLRGQVPENGLDGYNIRAYFAGRLVQEIQGKIDSRADENFVEFSALFPFSDTA